jgi:hypothetical protein
MNLNDPSYTSDDKFRILAEQIDLTNCPQVENDDREKDQGKSSRVFYL